MEAGGPLTSRLSGATAGNGLGGDRHIAQPPASAEGAAAEGREDEAAEGIPVMFLRRPSIRQFRTVWVEPRAAGEHGIKEQVGSAFFSYACFCTLFSVVFLLPSSLTANPPSPLTAVSA